MVGVSSATLNVVLRKTRTPSFLGRCHAKGHTRLLAESKSEHTLLRDKGKNYKYH